MEIIYFGDWEIWFKEREAGERYGLRPCRLRHFLSPLVCSKLPAGNKAYLRNICAYLEK
jgi:hypothetical protein